MMTQTNNLISVTTEEFREKVVETSQRIPVLVDFWADWCGPCRVLAPVLESLAKSYGEKLLIAKVNADTEAELTASMGVRSLPTLVLFRNGGPINHLVGAQPEGAVRALIDPYVEKESDILLREAHAALAADDTEKALTALRHAARAEPDNPIIQLEIADILLQSGQTEAAEQVLTELPANVREEPAAKRLGARLAFTRERDAAEDEASLAHQIESDPGNLEARYQLGASKILAGDYANGMDQFLEIMQRDRRFRDDIGREGMLAAFELIGDDHELVNRYRRRMAALLH